MGLPGCPMVELGPASAGLFHAGVPLGGVQPMMRLGVESGLAALLLNADCVEEVPSVSVRPWARPLQVEFI
jgi:hypothetical protein